MNELVWYIILYYNKYLLLLSLAKLRMHEWNEWMMTGWSFAFPFALACHGLAWLGSAYPLSIRPRMRAKSATQDKRTNASRFEYHKCRWRWWWWRLDDWLTDCWWMGWKVKGFISNNKCMCKYTPRMQRNNNSKKTFFCIKSRARDSSTFNFVYLLLRFFCPSNHSTLHTSPQRPSTLFPSIPHRLQTQRLKCINITRWLGWLAGLAWLSEWLVCLVSLHTYTYTIPTRECLWMQREI